MTMIAEMTFEESQIKTIVKDWLERSNFHLNDMEANNFVMSFRDEDYNEIDVARLGVNFYQDKAE